MPLEAVKFTSTLVNQPVFKAPKEVEFHVAYFIGVNAFIGDM